MTALGGKVVVITGASSGIGEATALHLAERGAQVVLGARRIDRLTDLVERIVKAGGEAVAMRTDVTRRSDLEWDRMVDVNIKGVLHGIGAALPVFRAQAGGHFVTVGSTAAFRIVPTMAVYAGTKHAVRAICEGLRQEAGGSVRVTTVSPGPIDTGFAEGSSNPAVREQIIEMRDRIAIPPNAVARAIAFAIEQPGTVDVSEIVVRPTAQS